MKSYKEEYLAAIDKAIARIREINEGFDKMIETNARLIESLNRPERFTNIDEQGIVHK